MLPGQVGRVQGSSAHAQPPAGGRAGAGTPFASLEGTTAHPPQDGRRLSNGRASCERSWARGRVPWSSVQSSADCVRLQRGLLNRIP
jgi:hypothetical protein